MNNFLNKQGSIGILNIRIDLIDLENAAKTVIKWASDKTNRTRYVVTPNVEIIMEAQHNESFRTILNNSDLAVADSSRIIVADKIFNSSQRIKKISYLIFFLFPFCIRNSRVKTVTGVDLMDMICKMCSDINVSKKKKLITIGLLGGGDGVAKSAKECLIRKYPHLKILYAESGPIVDKEGDPINGFKLPIPVDILFVAFGHPKQEKWISNNLNNISVKVLLGVGGAFDYLSGSVLRAPFWMRKLGLEWLFRLLIQPWRIKRQLVLVYFIYKVISV